ncbi:DUF4087 domain-containing protein [Roseomonas sp. CECT 9278]|uniref:DUF4087 domain-containing protein n=1 Tax=Roseomonas sp. CECT 9278 TaxID=2845823 RepID=UPI001E2DFC89|nr:DUF4087 domain-containing protein [Roseomonas sp. CECT 9278]CAH0311464.1 hypothetical protein ROS9278_04953 [Roseomonas sp. CECT 9278]
MRAAWLSLCLIPLLGGPLASPAEASDRRCGWLHNPSPGNYWLTDRDGDWIMASQGAPQTPGMNRVPDMTVRQWVRTNGYYGYGCACVVMDADARRTVRRIHAVEQLPLARCQNDRTLPPP